MDYKELVESLRFMAKQGKRYGMAVITMGEAADAIEQLQKFGCPHYIRNVHDRGDDSLCRKFGCEVKKLPRWIPVTERLPEDNNRVITVGPKGGIQICRFSASTPTLPWHFWMAGNARTATVTHWMPLPEPPKEEPDA